MIDKKELQIINNLNMKVGIISSEGDIEINVKGISLEDIHEVKDSYTIGLINGRLEKLKSFSINEESGILNLYYSRFEFEKFIGKNF